MLKENSEEWRRMRREYPAKAWEKEKKVWVVRTPFRRNFPSLDDAEEVTLGYAKRYKNDLIGPFASKENVVAYITNFGNQNEEIINEVPLMLSKNIPTSAKKLAALFKRDIEKLGHGLDGYRIDDKKMLKDVVTALAMIAKENGLRIKLTNMPQNESKMLSLAEIFAEIE